MNEIKIDLARNKIKKIMLEAQFKPITNDLLDEVKQKIQHEMYLIFNEEIRCSASLVYDPNGISAVAILPATMENFSFKCTILNQRVTQKSKQIFLDFGDE